MKDAELKNLQKKMASLGIINIEADGDFSVELMKDAIDVVESMNIDIKALAQKSRNMVATK